MKRMKRKTRHDAVTDAAVIFFALWLLALTALCLAAEWDNINGKADNAGEVAE